MNITKEQLEKESLVFNNEDRQNEEAFEIVLHFNQISTWDNPYKLFVNGELKASFKNFASFLKRAEKLIKENNLEFVEYYK